MRAVLVVLSVSVFYAAHAESAEPARSPFTVRHSIEMTRILVAAPGSGVNAAAGTALFSPDRSLFVLHTRRGDLARNVNIESLLLFKTSDVEKYLASPESTAKPAPRLLVQRSIADDWGGLSRIQWLNGREVGFVAQENSDRSQAFAVNVATANLSQLTQSETPVVSFTASADDVLFYAHVKPTQDLVRAVSEESIYEITIPDSPIETPIQMFRGSRSTGGIQPIDAPAMRLWPDAEEIWLSPAGDYAVALAPAVNSPGHWADYRVPGYEQFGYTPDRVSSDPTSWDMAMRTRYHLIDLQKNTSRPLLDAPSGGLTFNRTPLEVFWPKDGRSVIVSNTYLPLGIKDPDIRTQRTLQPAIAEIDLQSGEATVISWEPVLADEQRAAGVRPERVVSINWDGDSGVLTISRMVAITEKNPQGQIRYERFQRSHGQWRPIRATRGNSARNLPEIQQRESLNERPKVYAVGGQCACRKLLFDPNPQADQFLFGRAEIFRWTDRNDIEWQGGLIYPPDYVVGRRYPLVVQTHGFRADEFLIDGPARGTTAMAAQALANAGIVVLQVEDNRAAFTLDEREGPLFAEGFRAAIERLISQGIAERSRVGLIGFSRTGYHALHLMARQPDLLAAATISDALQQGYMSDLLLTNYSVDSAIGIRKLSSGAPEIERIGEWFARNPLYKLPGISTAIRLEANGPGSVLGLWESYAILRNANRPVDFLYFPEGSHVLMKPAERLGSQGGNVDWFRFWLQNYEDPDRAKAEQYTRWRELRDRRDALVVRKQPVQ